MRLLRQAIRKIMGTRERESIIDSWIRKKSKFQKVIFKKRISKEEFKSILQNIGLEKGTNVMVHASWRQFYNFEGKPEDIIDSIKDVIGSEGTILMPSYGIDKYYFDVDHSPSAAGVLSEVFRKKYATHRSACTNFSVSGYGKNAKEITKSHIESVYGFDELSPYYLLSKYKDSKILFLGLSKTPTKISLFHCVGYFLRKEISFFDDVYTEKIETKLVYNSKNYNKSMINRNPKYKNNEKVFKKIYKELDMKKIYRVSNLDIVLLDVDETFKKAIEFNRKGKYIYKKNVIR